MQDKRIVHGQLMNEHRKLANEIADIKANSYELNEEEKNLEQNYTRLWRYLASDDSIEIRGQKSKGLHLNQNILEKVYAKNAINLLKLE